MLTRNPTLPAAALDEEADRIGALVGVRVTFIAPDGKVLGDSTQSGAALAAMENHGKRPEIIAAARTRGEVLRQALQHDDRIRHALRRHARSRTPRSPSCGWRCP